MVKRGERITQVWAFIALDEANDCEGIIAFQGPHPQGVGMTWMPMVCADIARVRQLMPIAREMVQKSGKKIKLVRFHGTENLGNVSEIDIEEEFDRM